MFKTNTVQVLRRLTNKGRTVKCVAPFQSCMLKDTVKTDCLSVTYATECIATPLLLRSPSFEMLPLLPPTLLLPLPLVLRIRTFTSSRRTVCTQNKRQSHPSFGVRRVRSRVALFFTRLHTKDYEKERKRSNSGKTRTA
jgi:hypothetical protein